MDIDKSLISQAEWARDQGVSKQYVSKLVKTGKIVLVDGKIDPEDAARRLTAQQDPLKRAKKSTESTGDEQSIWVPAEFEDVEVAPPENESPEEKAERERKEAAKLPHDLLRARIKREREEGRLKELERKRREGELVDAAEVREEQLRRASDEREALLNWPSRIAAVMAAELEIEERRLLTVLRKYVRLHLGERSKA